ncbi:MAG: hypothetical protein KGJ56_06670 [Gammaproteobacteria bacterium]|nr:hypothetical protein [Gammaproteobacteria bacterium]
MDCNRLHTYLDTEPLVAPPAEVLEHLSQCASCREAWALAGKVQRILRSLPEPYVPLGFEERVLILSRRASEHRHHRVARGWALALAATLLLGISIGIVLQWAAAPMGGYQLRTGAILVPADTATVVRIALDAAHPLHHVGFTVNVPQGMQLQGHPGEQQVAWSGELAQGRNVLNLRLVARSGAAGTLETALHYAGQDNIFKVQVVAIEDESLRGIVRRLLARMKLV